MKHPILLAMSLLSLLFGCSPKKTPAAQAREWPRFPESDNPAVKIEPVQLDSGFGTKSFFITENKQEVYVLGYKRFGRKNPDDPSEIERWEYRMYALDTGGKIKKRLDLKDIRSYSGTSMGMLDSQLMLRIRDQFIVLDPIKFTFGEKIPVYDSQSFPSKQKVELMTPDEQRDAYLTLFDRLLEKPERCKWLEWPPIREYLVFAQDPADKRSAWSPISYEDEVLGDLRSRLEPVRVPVNPAATDPYKDSMMEITDAAAHIRETEALSAGTELDYPNYKNRLVLQHEMTLGDQTLHFSTTDKKRHNLKLDYSDNLLLSTSDGAAWIKYEGVLYRLESVRK